MTPNQRNALKAAITTLEGVGGFVKSLAAEYSAIDPTLAKLRAALAEQDPLLQILARRARMFPHYPLGYHIPEVFAALGEEPPVPPSPVIGLKTWFEDTDGLVTEPLTEADVYKEPAPIDMVLYCPACGTQHIDAAWTPGQPLTNAQITGAEAVWTNPPHRSHLCHACDHVWRPADVYTNGVKDIKTEGKNDSEPARPAEARAEVAYVLQDELHNRLTPRVVDIAYSAFMAGRSGKNRDDGGPCDWFNDTRPMVMEQIGKIAKAVGTKEGG